MTNAENLITIATFPEPMEANMARSAIESAGIDVFLQGETANSLIPVAFAARLQVRPEDEAAARTVLNSLDNAPESLESVTAAEIEAESDAQFDSQRDATAKDPAR
jgi:hypothetical protein